MERIVSWIGRYSMSGLLLALIFLGCGGGSSTKSKQMEDGRIFVENQTDGGVLYTIVDNDSQVVVADGNVDAHTTKEITTNPIKGGTKIKLRLVARIGTTNSKDMDLTIDGNIKLRVPNTGTWGSGYLPVEIVS